MELFRESDLKFGSKLSHQNIISAATSKFQWMSLNLNEVADLACNIIKKEFLAQVFSYEFCESFKNTFFTEHLRVSASINW